MKTTTSEIRNKVAGLSGIPASYWEADQPLSDILLDSFAIIDLSIAIQQEYAIIFNQSELAELVTAEDLFQLIRGKLSETVSAV